MLLFTDSFDHYATGDITEKWTQLYNGTAGATTSIGSGNGRRTTNGARFAVDSTFASACDAMAVTIGGTTDTCLLGFAFKASGTGSFAVQNSAWDSTTKIYPWMTGGSSDRMGANVIAYVRSDTFTQVALIVNSNGTLTVVRGDDPTTNTPGKVILSTTADAILWGETYYIEIKTKIHASNGTFKLVVNGDTWLDLSGIQTYHDDGEGLTPTVGWNEVVIGKASSGGSGLGVAGQMIWDYDDLYIGDTDSTDVNNTIVDLIGDVAIDWRAPTQDGAMTDWSLSAGTDHFDNVNDNPPDDDTTYNYSVDPNDIDTFVIEDVPISGVDIIAVNVIHSARRPSAGASSTANVVRIGGSNYADAGTGNTTSYTFNEWIINKNPSDQTTITEANFNAYEVGYKKIS